MGSGHPELAPLACDLYCSKGPTLRRDPTSALPVLKCLIFLEQGVPHVCFVSHTFIFTGSCKLGSWSWAPSGMLMKKERCPPSFAFLPYQIHKQIVLPFPPTCFPLPSISLPPHSTPQTKLLVLSPGAGLCSNKTLFIKASGEARYSPGAIFILGQIISQDSSLSSVQ